MSRTRPVLLLGLIGAALALVRRRNAQRNETDLWGEVTAAPDLR